MEVQFLGLEVKKRSNVLLPKRIHNLHLNADSDYSHGRNHEEKEIGSGPPDPKNTVIF